jgi:hypothetical protein
MAYKKLRRVVAPVQEYHPMAWVQVSGNDVDKDARWIVTLTQRAHQVHELWRLGFMHGLDYADKVQRQVVRLWPQRDEIVSQAGIVSMDDFLKMTFN